jgi:hypothetical protein
MRYSGKIPFCLRAVNRFYRLPAQYHHHSKTYMNRFIKQYPLAVLMIVSVLMLFSHLGLIQTNIMEARNLISARRMVKDGHWIFTTLNNMPRYEKPPLPTWITAVFMLDRRHAEYVCTAHPCGL